MHALIQCCIVGVTELHVSNLLPVYMANGIIIYAMALLAIALSTTEGTFWLGVSLFCFDYFQRRVDASNAVGRDIKAPAKQD